MIQNIIAANAPPNVLVLEPDNPMELMHIIQGGQIRFRVRFREYCGEWMDYLLASVPEVEQIIAGTGWHLTQTIGDTERQYALVLEKQ